MTGKTDREKVKEQLGRAIKDLADGLGALTNEDTSSSARCIKDFREAAGEWVYELLKKATQYYAGNVQEGPRIDSWPECPEFINADTEEDWVHVIYHDIIKTHINPERTPR